MRKGMPLGQELVITGTRFIDLVDRGSGPGVGLRTGNDQFL